MEQDVIKPYQVLKVQWLLFWEIILYTVLKIIVSALDALWFLEAGKQR